MLPASPQETETGFALKKRVSWKGVFVREYNVTVGDHPMCSDHLPLSLDWSHSDDIKVKNIESSRERQSNYRFPKRLSFEERRKRIFGEDQQQTGNCEWVRPASLGPKAAHEQSLMDLDEGLEQDKEEYDAAQSVIYCPHVRDEDDDDDDDDSMSFIFDWRRLTNF